MGIPVTDFPILARPSITAATFAAVLARSSSPAAGAAGDAYRAAVAYGVDPAVLLAVFQRESGYGRAGVARFSRSWGNLRTSPHYPSAGGFARYPSWETGAADTARLLRIYGKNAIRHGVDTSTVRAFPYVWAPTADGNAPASYGAALVRLILAYRKLGAAPAVSVKPTHRTPYAGVRVRARASTSSAIRATLPAGATVTTTGTVTGAAYRLPDGRRGTAWLRVVAVNGRALPAHAYTAALLWVRL